MKLTVEQFNEMYPVGSTVWYHPILGKADREAAVVKYPAFENCAGYPVVFLDVRSSYVAADHIRHRRAA